MEQTEQLKTMLNEIIIRNDQKELDMLSTVLKNFDGSEHLTWMEKIYPFHMTFTEDSGTLTVKKNEFMHNTMDTLHGGMFMLIADTLMGSLCNHLLDDTKQVVTLDMTTYFLRKGVGDTIRAVAKPIKKGSTTIVAQCDIYIEDKHIGYATGTFYIIDRPSV